MAYFVHLKEKVFEYVSPSHKPLYTPQIQQPLGQRLDRVSMSPTSRTTSWLAHHQTDGTSSRYSTSTNRTPSVLGVKGSRVMKRARTASPAASQRSYKSVECGRTVSPIVWPRSSGWFQGWFSKTIVVEEDESYEVQEAEEEDHYEADDRSDLDGPTLVGNDERRVLSESKSRYYGDTNDEVEEEEDDDHDSDAEPKAVKRPEPRYYGDDSESDEFGAERDGEIVLKDDAATAIRFPTVEDEELMRKEALKRIAEGGSSQAENALFEKLQMRGYEPLMPKHWEFDFETIPRSLFTSDDKRAFIKSASGNHFRATKALQNLMYLGVRVRDKIDAGLSPEELMKSTIESYIKWSEQDGQLFTKNYIPNLVVITSRPEIPAKIAEAVITARIHRLAERYRHATRIHKSVEVQKAHAVAAAAADNDGEDYSDASEAYSRPLPTIYGMIIRNSIVAMVSHNSVHTGAPLRPVAIFKFGDSRYDVWNAFAVAILVIQARNYLMGLRDEMENKSVIMKDPDA